MTLVFASSILTLKIRYGRDPKYDRGSCRSSYVRSASHKHIDTFRDQARPSGLMTGADPSPVVAMKVFIEEHSIPPMRIMLKFLGPPVDRPAATGAAEENPCETVRELIGDLSK